MRTEHCCNRCKTPFSVCARQRNCPCHAEPSPRADIALTPAEIREACRQISEFAPWK